MMTDKQRPYILENYIRKQFEIIGDNNACEHRPTPISELEREEKRILELYNRGLEIKNKISNEDKIRCRNLYETKVSEYGAVDLIEYTVMGKRVIVPRYIAWYDEMVKLREAIA
jgi:hypothetical protein